MLMSDIKNIILNIDTYDSVYIITEYQSGKKTNRKGMVFSIMTNIDSDFVSVGTTNSTYNKVTGGQVLKEGIIKTSPFRDVGEMKFIGICRLVLIEKYYKDNYLKYE